MRDFQLNFFFNLGSHMDSHGTPPQGYSQAGCRESSAKLGPREIAPHRKGVLPSSILSVYSFHIIVPVVQRIEQGFPKTKAAFPHTSSAVLSTTQTTS